MKYESLGQITSYWVGQDKQGRYNVEESWWGAQFNPRTRPEWTYSRGAARDSRSIMYKMYRCYAAIHIKRKDLDIMRYLCVPLFMINYLLLIAYCSVVHVLCLISCFFCRLKINHDSHEFILEFRTVANNYNTGCDR
jgi:hypothetical protein